MDGHFFIVSHIHSPPANPEAMTWKMRVTFFCLLSLSILNPSHIFKILISMISSRKCPGLVRSRDPRAYFLIMTTFSHELTSLTACSHEREGFVGHGVPPASSTAKLGSPRLCHRPSGSVLFQEKGERNNYYGVRSGLCEVPRIEVTSQPFLSLCLHQIQDLQHAG